MNTLKKITKIIWDSLPPQISENKIEHIRHRWELCIKYKGRRLDKELKRKISKVKNYY